jgi:L-amino acid N-acyltransferase YncA
MNGCLTHAISIAIADDIEEILALQSENQISRGGALSIEFPRAWFERAVRDLPIMIARREGRLVGFLVSSSREATRHLALIEAKYLAYAMVAPDAYNSGPLCVAASERGSGLAAVLFEAQRIRMGAREGVAFIRCDNAASRAAHAKNGFREMAEFSFAGVSYVTVARPGRVEA